MTAIKLLILNKLFFETIAFTGKPLPKPLSLYLYSKFESIVSTLEELKTMVLLTPESKMKFSFLLLTLIGITIRLLIN